ncbi:ribose/xylose/arabinose/galactoside ABC-type transport system permease subunit [Allocatelliglobosispora scoriae]|uniref:Ribose/xylose/arabinose/galactoside ABC-type transport system permease subunit n=1 Tax=Allocatelliglobosispora scoriae TaxID=643052 RepID=A0A841BN72_9ACTN|nr:hypothetical protein [Allocatelliglobosispora scoriae]MBB5868403.1 ribose/xylose/arabinose/galactoside ABC-type transport system permease subunit [Allocatelliglobosispora scoriae]
MTNPAPDAYADPFATPTAPPPPVVPATPPPRQGIAGRELIVHIGWEALLAIATLGAIVLLLNTSSRAGLDTLLSQVAPLGLIGAAMALSLRTGTPNLAVGALAVGAGTIGAELTTEQMPLVGAMAIGVASAVIAALFIGLITAVLSVPTWAVTLGAAALIEAGLLAAFHSKTIVILTEAGGKQPLWFVAFAVLTLAGGAIWLIPGLRRTLSHSRGAVAAGPWAGFRPGIGAIVGLTGSAFLAGLGGVAFTLRLHASPPPGISGTLTLTALAIALLGGVSVFGRRAGVTGTLFAAVLIGTITQLLALEGFASWSNFLVAGGAILIGLVVSRIIESASGPTVPAQV